MSNPVTRKKGKEVPSEGRRTRRSAGNNDEGARHMSNPVTRNKGKEVPSEGRRTRQSAGNNDEGDRQKSLKYKNDMKKRAAQAQKKGIERDNKKCS
jgi:hypothetical protein